MAHFSWKPNEIHKTLLVKNNGIAATVARRQKNCVRRNFQTSHNRNLPGNGSFDATPVAALAGGVLDTQRLAAQT